MELSTRQNYRLRLAFLGTPQIILDGAPLTEFKSRKGLALLVYLAMTAQPQARAKLAGLLWGELPEVAAANNLRVVLHHLKKHLSDYLIITRTTIAFDQTGDYWLDTEELQSIYDRADEQMSIPRLAETLALYRGEFLEGVFLDDCPEFEQWIMVERERWQQLVLRWLRYLVEAEIERGEYDAAVAHVQRLLAIAPWYEEGHRQSMRLWAMTGQRSAALAQYYQCRRTLYTELGVLPDEQTEILHRRIVQENRETDSPWQVTALLTSFAPETAPSTTGVPLSILQTRMLAQLARAAERAWQEYAHETTLNFLAAALYLVPRDDDERRWELLSTRERVYHFIADRAAQAQDLTELIALAERLADTPKMITTRMRQIQYACRVGEYAQARTWSEQTLEQATKYGDTGMLARIREVVGETYWNLGDYAAARGQLERALKYYLAADDRSGEVRARNGLGNIWRRLGEIDRARREWERALQIYQTQDNDWGMGMVLNNLGALAIDSGDYPAALEYHQQALAIRQELGDRRGEGSSRNNLSMVYYLLGDYETARAHITAAITLAREIGERSWLVSFLETATRVELARRNYAEAQALCQEGLALSVETGDRHNTAFYHHNLGEIALARGETAQAVAAYSHACAIRRELDECGNLSASLAGRAVAYLAQNSRALALADARMARSLLQEVGHAGEYAVDEVRGRIETAPTRGAA